MDLSTTSGTSRGAAVVTGGSRGLGRGIAHALAAAGYGVVVAGSSAESGAHGVVDEIRTAGGRAAAGYGDVSDPVTHEHLVRIACDEFGTLDAWVNNAGISVLAPVVDTDPAAFTRMLDVNVLGVFHGTRIAARWMLDAHRPGRIVNIASELGVQAFPYLGAYAATKFAVVGLTQAAAIELAPQGITVNAVCPGTAETDMVLAERTSEVTLTGRTSDEVRAAYLDAIPARRFCTPDDVGATVAWLVGAPAGFVTGQAICVNGGAVVH